MPLGQKAVTELWTPVMNKKTGQAYTGLEQCASLERLEQEDKALSDLLDEKLNAWVDADTEAHEKELRDFKKGFQYKHENGYTYKIIQFDNGEYKLSRSKGFGGAGGYKKGYGGSTYIHLRTVSVSIVRPEVIPGLVNDQQPNDNFELIQLQPDSKGDKFLLLNKKPYTPTVESATSSGNKETTTESKESEETETDSETTE